MVRSLLLISGFWLLVSSPTRDLLIAILLGVIEGVTEFVPISSTGHILLAQHWLIFNMDSGFWKTFAVVIQIGAIAAVVVYFRGRIAELLKQGLILAPGSRGLSPAMMILLATIPVLVVGVLADQWVEQHMEHPRTIAWAVGIGGILMLLLELLPRTPVTSRIEDMSVAQALLVGFSQIFAVIFPGTSRSAATIMGGLIAGLTRPAAAEFSFFLAIPAMAAATGYVLLKQLRSDAGMTGHELLVLAIGTLVSFTVAWAVIAAFMKFIRRHTFIPFAIYRLILAIVVFIAVWGE